jgi:hypothetical protein
MCPPVLIHCHLPVAPRHFSVPTGRKPSTLAVRLKPGVTGPVAILILTRRARDISSRKRFTGTRNLSPNLIYWALRLTTGDMKPRNIGGDIGPQGVDNADGFDFDPGFGFMDAQRALRATRGF